MLKIPVFIEHFLEHKERNKDITFIGFLKMHYNHPVKDADYQTDQKTHYSIIGFGADGCRILSGDPITDRCSPDITNNQVQVITTAPSFGATDGAATWSNKKQHHQLELVMRCKIQLYEKVVSKSS